MGDFPPERPPGARMTPELWARIERALHVLLERPSGEWPDLIDELCDGDPELEREVRSLIGRDSEIRGFLEPPVLSAAGEEDPPPPDLEGRSLGSYRVLREIARGGMGWVYLAEDTTLGRRVALKVLPPEMAEDAGRLARFEREARIVAALSHPNIVTIHSIEEADGVRFLTMELVEGRPLDRVAGRSPVPPERFLEIALPLTEAVAAAHERGVTHRDLKPANIMVTDEGHLKVLDFGVAKPREAAVGIGGEGEADGSTVTLTEAGAIFGTVTYMSPEQVLGREVDHRSDLFSLGVVFFELLTGERPFRGESAAEIVSAILRDEPPPASRLRSDLPASADRLVDRCLEKEPDRRIQSARELLVELEELEREVAAGASRRTPSMAVLPFLDMSPQKDQGYFCEGISEELINALGRIEHLRLASRTSSFQFQGEAADVREIGRRLGVSTVLEGSVRKAGDRIRVTAQLVNAADGYRVWSDRYDRETRDIFAIQEEIAESIVEALELTLNPRERRALRQVSTRDIEAYEYYLRGRRFFYRLSRRGFQFARQLYERAIALDPNYALAHVGLADCCAFLSQYSERMRPNLERADEASRRALELDPELAEAHASRGLVLSLEGRHSEAEAAFDTALRLDPKLYEAYYFYARTCQARWDYAGAARLYEKAAEVRPEAYEAQRLLLKALAGMGAPTSRVEAAAREALRRVEDHLELNPDNARAYSFGAPCLLLLGERERAFEWSRKAEELEPDEPIIHYNKACLLSLDGEAEEALGLLERAVRGGFAHRDWIEVDPDFEPLRGHPGFRSLLASMEEAR